MADIPITNKTTIDVADKCTTIHCTSYADRHFILVTQLESFGSWLHAWVEECADGKLLFQTKVLLGRRDDPVLHIFARQIIEKIALTSADSVHSASRKPLVLAIGLEESGRSAKAMEAILNKLFEINTWQ